MAKGHRSQIKRERNANKDTRPSAKLSYARVSVQKACFVLASMKKVKRGEIYYADLSPIIGSEQDGMRPVLVLQNDVGNKHSPTTIVAAITSRKTKAALPTNVTFMAEFMKSESIVLLEQIRTIDKTRLGECIGKIDKDTMGAVDKAIIVSFGIKYMEVLLK